MVDRSRTGAEDHTPDGRWYRILRHRVAGGGAVTVMTDITVVLVDLRGFTGFTETAEPEDVMSVLREYHAELGREIMAHDGIVEHFAGGYATMGTIG